MYKSLKIRLYPTKEQEELIWKHIHACRFVWNYMVDIQEINYENGGKYLNGFRLNNLLSKIMNDDSYSWLREVSCSSLQYICSDVHQAYRKFFNKTAGHPCFKTKKSRHDSYPVCANRFYFADRKYVQIQKLGRVRYKTDFCIPCGREHKFIEPKIVCNCGKWILCVTIECEKQARELTECSMGIDLGVKDLAIVELDGEKIVFPNINKSKKMRKIKEEIKRIKSDISNKYKINNVDNKKVKTKNIIKKENKLRKLYAKARNIRMNYLHQTTHSLIEKLPYKVVMEGLDVVDLMKNKYWRESISEQCWAEFIRQMKYKCEWNGIEFVQADRFYPSSKTCSCCGNIKKDLSITDRVYVCDVCGLTIDRDYNAAINLSKYIA